MIAMSMDCSSRRRSGNHTLLPCAVQADCAPLRLNDPDVFPAESDVLAGHVVERRRRIPGLEWVRRIPGKVRCIDRRRRRRLSVDGRHQDQIASGIVDLAASDCQCVPVFLEPHAVIEHKADKTLLRIDPRTKIVPPTDFASFLSPWQPTPCRYTPDEVVVLGPNSQPISPVKVKAILSRYFSGLS